MTYVLKRSNSNIKVWDSQNKGTALLDFGAETTITFSAATKTVWVENPSGGSNDLELIARSGTTDICSDKVHFYPFTSIVIALGGEDRNPSDPANTDYGVFQLATNLYQQGYDVHMYNENNVNNVGAGAAYDEVVNAIQHRNVGAVAVFGSSHGGGSTHDLAERLNNNRGIIGTFTIPFTAYIDAINNTSDFNNDKEQRRPPGTGFHLNYYQEGSFVDGWLCGGPIIPAMQPNEGFDINVDVLNPPVTHFTIDNDAAVLNGIEISLTLRVNQ